MTRQPKSHFSPVFANKRWGDETSHVLSYFRDPCRELVRKAPKGARQWGRSRGLYSWKVERSLNIDLENEAALVYEKLCAFDEITLADRIIWAQFLMSQMVRTPTFIRYEKRIREALEIEEEPMHDRVGCKECMDLTCITSRDWRYLLAHADDHFVRSDNPVLLTGFVERAQTCLYYPLTPKLCFVACSMPVGWVPVHPEESDLNQMQGCQLEKGGAHMINFHLARAADRSLMLSPRFDGRVAEAMFGDVLGSYPQPPFSLHHVAHPREIDQAYESVRRIMSFVDERPYPHWRPFELEPFPAS
jgi:hypothetical protein